MVEKHQRRNKKPTTNEDCYSAVRMEKIMTDCEWRICFQDTQTGDRLLFETSDW